ncbi:hypothetical protein D3C73_1231660 [compost metagenome]
MIGLESGSTTLRINLRSLQPSISLASSSSSGIEDWKNERAIITCHTQMAFGISKAQRVSMRCISLTTIYVGMRPPLKIIVKVMTIISTLRPKNVRRESG